MGITKQKAAPSVMIERAYVKDILEIHELLVRSNLPLDGFDQHIGTTVVAWAEHGNGPRQIVGNATLEVYGRYALLRSVAVDEKLRGQGLGQRLTQAALDLARELGVRGVYLLTETAAGFYPRFGFEQVGREDVPTELMQSAEFTTACPTSATVMRLSLVAKSRLVARVATKGDAEAIARIYNEGIEDRVATFETRLRSAEDVLGWLDGVHPVVVVEDDGAVIGFASTSSYRSRECYEEIAEFSVYVAREARGHGAGRVAMEKLLEEAERAGFWKLLSRIFPENSASLRLMRSLGFREVGRYEKHARLDGVWRDVVIAERLIPGNIR